MGGRQIARDIHGDTSANEVLDDVAQRCFFKPVQSGKGQLRRLFVAEINRRTAAALAIKVWQEALAALGVIAVRHTIVAGAAGCSIAPRGRRGAFPFLAGMGLGVSRQRQRDTAGDERCKHERNQFTYLHGAHFPD